MYYSVGEVRILKERFQTDTDDWSNIMTTCYSLLSQHNFRCHQVIEPLYEDMLVVEKALKILSGVEE